MKYYKYDNQLGKVTQSYLSVCFQMHKLQKFNNVCICITHHPLLVCRIPRGSQGYSSPNLSASSVRSTRKSSLRGKSHEQNIPDWFMRVSTRLLSVALLRPWWRVRVRHWQRCWSTLAIRRTEHSPQTSPLIQNTGNGETRSNQRAERD